MIFSFLVGLAALAAACYIQNGAFTWSSRSRNSQDPNYHRYAAWASNGIYYVTNALITVYIVKHQEWWALGLQGVIYTIFASEGSVKVMRVLMGKEKGKQAVGANKNYAQIPVEDWTKIQEAVAKLPRIEGLAQNAYDMALEGMGFSPAPPKPKTVVEGTVQPVPRTAGVPEPPPSGGNVAA